MFAISLVYSILRCFFFNFNPSCNKSIPECVLFSDETPMKSPVMKFKHSILISMMIFLPKITSAQNLETHRWQDRLVVVMAPDMDDPSYLEQMDILRQDTAGLAERRLVIYTATPATYMTGLRPGPMEKSEKLYREYKRLRTTFEVVLIGLDGGVKLRQGTPLSLQELFSTIDAMPMRRQELRREKN